MAEKQHPEGQGDEANPEKMGTGELFEAIVWMAIGCNNSLKGLDGQGSPYHSETEIRKGIINEYRKKVGPFLEELNRRTIK